MNISKRVNLNILTLFCFCFLSFFSSVAQQACSTVEQMITIDATWEESLLRGDEPYLSELLTDNFLWVHNHASLIDTKSDVLERALRTQKQNYIGTKSRVSRHVSVRLVGGTAVVSGFTLVDRNLKAVNYHFMRTYVSIDGACKLMSNHTMAIPEED